MLEAIRENLDGLSEPEQGHYVEKDGKFHLDVGVVDGMALEDVTGLKSTIGKLRTSDTTLTKKLADLTSRYEDIDPEEARNALSKMNEIKDWNGDQKIAEAVEAAKRELVKQHTKVKESLEGELTDAQEQLTEAIVTSKVVEALNKEEGNITLLMPHVKQHVRMVKNSDGKFIPEVINDAGEQRIGDSDGAPMTIGQYIAEMKTMKDFAPGFPGANSTGTGHHSSENNKQKRTSNTGSKTVAATDGRGMSVSVEDIASGKTTVDMSK